MKIDNEEKERRARIVVDDCAGIQFPQEAFYIHSISYSAGRCIEVFERYANFKNEDISPSYLVALVQEAVGHAAALSRYFWPTPNKKKAIANQMELRSARASKLRFAFEQTEHSPLYNRDLRNAWEHFDERLDEYLLSHMAGTFYPTAIIGSHEEADAPTNHIFKLLDTENECLVLMNEKYFYLPIYQEVKKVFDLAMQFDNEGARLPRPAL
ncbi:conserved hypothetical protein [Vibrio crassostreae]|nr:conserved hypothetical protein [Vibrio crassostreae]CAK3059439.1 conserved hypothetical protein [Vibrio crassostreae]CAK3071653.1 conserved hypothetical protein [Vibrio crassostreae]CAK3073901.1 conserved hypothetical protein [Vibrio crassostreae]CAK3074183.1 conserved hypothetical protein [Vibrio crassostreae]